MLYWHEVPFASKNTQETATFKAFYFHMWEVLIASNYKICHFKRLWYLFLVSKYQLLRKRKNAGAHFLRWRRELTICWTLNGKPSCVFSHVTSSFLPRCRQVSISSAQQVNSFIPIFVDTDTEVTWPKSESQDLKPGLASSNRMHSECRPTPHKPWGYGQEGCSVREGGASSSACKIGHKSLNLSGLYFLFCKMKSMEETDDVSGCFQL